MIWCDDVMQHQQYWINQSRVFWEESISDSIRTAQCWVICLWSFSCLHLWSHLQVFFFSFLYHWEHFDFPSFFSHTITPFTLQLANIPTHLPPSFTIHKRIAIHTPYIFYIYHSSAIHLPYIPLYTHTHTCIHTYIHTPFIPYIHSIHPSSAIHTHHTYHTYTNDVYTNTFYNKNKKNEKMIGQRIRRREDICRSFGW